MKPQPVYIDALDFSTEQRLMEHQASWIKGYQTVCIPCIRCSHRAAALWQVGSKENSSQHWTMACTYNAGCLLRGVQRMRPFQHINNWGEKKSVRIYTVSFTLFSSVGSFVFLFFFFFLTILKDCIHNYFHYPRTITSHVNSLYNSATKLKCSYNHFVFQSEQWKQCSERQKGRERGGLGWKD